MSSYFPTGSTVRAIATFTDYALPGTTAALVAPSSVVVNIYNSTPTLIGGPFTPVNDSTGVYHYDYLIPGAEGIYYIEFLGTVGSENSLSRVKIVAKFDPAPI